MSKVSSRVRYYSKHYEEQPLPYDIATNNGYHDEVAEAKKNEYEVAKKAYRNQLGFEYLHTLIRKG